MDIQVGEHAIDYAQVAQKEKMTELQLRIRQLLNQVDQITKEQNYQRVSPPSCNPYSIPLLVDSNVPSIYFSIAKNDSVSPAKVQTNACCTGPWPKSLFSFRWASGRCVI